MYIIIYKKKAVKSLAKMPQAIALKFRLAFDAIANDADENLDIKVMECTSGYRLRIGSYRALFEVDNGVLIITVFNVGSRGDIYK